MATPEAVLRSCLDDIDVSSRQLEEQINLLAKGNDGVVPKDMGDLIARLRTSVTIMPSSLEELERIQNASLRDSMMSNMRASQLRFAKRAYRRKLIAIARAGLPQKAGRRLIGQHCQDIPALTLLCTEVNRELPKYVHLSLGKLNKELKYVDAVMTHDAGDEESSDEQEKDA